MTDSPLHSTSSEPQPALPANGIRTAVSFLLFVYLFGLAVCIGSTPRDQLYSSLQFKLRRIPGLVSLLHSLWLDNGYDYVHFTGTFNERGEFIALNGTDFQIDAELQLADGTTQRIKLPKVGRWPLVRYQRHKNLCRSSAAFVGDREREGLLPKLICEWLLREAGAQVVTLQIRNHLPQGRNEVTSSESAQRDPFSDRYYRTVFRCRAQIVDGQPVFLEIKSAGESAPVARPAAGAASPASTVAPPPTDLERPARPRGTAPFNLPVRP